jgi:hypothetical protein
LLLPDVLKEEYRQGRPRQIHHREPPDRPASEAKVATETLGRQRRPKARMLTGCCRSLKGEKLPPGEHPC